MGNNVAEFIEQESVDECLGQLDGDLDSVTRDIARDLLEILLPCPKFFEATEDWKTAVWCIHSALDGHDVGAAICERLSQQGTTYQAGEPTRFYKWHDTNRPRNKKAFATLRKRAAELGTTELALEMDAKFLPGRQMLANAVVPKPPKPQPGFSTLTAAAASIQVGELAAVYSDFTGGWFAVARYNLPSGKKEFRPFHRSPAGSWREGDPSGPLPLYRSHQLPADGPVWICEGEKATDAAWEIGLPTATSSHGAGQAYRTDWKPLAGRDVYLLPDNDAAGKKHARDVAGILLKLNPPARVKIVPLPDLPEKGDIVEFIQARSHLSADETRTEVEELVTGSPWLTLLDIFGGAVVISMDTVESRPVEWLWPGRIAVGTLTLLVGKPGAGKTFVTTDIASRVSTGTPWPDGTPCPDGSVMFINGEDDPGFTLRPRLEAHKADTRRVDLLDKIKVLEKGTIRETTFSLDKLQHLETVVQERPDCRLIIIDPVGSFLGGDVDSFRDNEVRSVLAPLAKLAASYHVAVLIVAHRRKGGGSVADEMALGSVAFTGIARTVYHLMPDPDDANRRLLLPGKNNLGPSVDGLAFSILGSPAAVTWEREPVKMTADEAMAKERDVVQHRAPRLTAASDWLRMFLSAGPRYATDVLSEGKKSGYTKDTLERASNKLQVKKGPAEFRGQWVWELAEEVAHA